MREQQATESKYFKKYSQSLQIFHVKETQTGRHGSFEEIIKNKMKEYTHEIFRQDIAYAFSSKDEVVG